MIEIISAKKYYRHRHALGSVVLINGYPMFHGSTPEARKLFKAWSQVKADARTKNGGARKGSGRKPSGKVQYITRLSPATIAKIRALAALQGVDDCQVVESRLRGLPDVLEPPSTFSAPSV